MHEEIKRAVNPPYGCASKGQVKLPPAPPAADDSWPLHSGEEAFKGVLLHTPREKPARILFLSFKTLKKDHSPGQARDKRKGKLPCVAQNRLLFESVCV
jgi:hypothetical protein